MIFQMSIRMRARIRRSRSLAQLCRRRRPEGRKYADEAVRGVDTTRDELDRQIAPGVDGTGA